MPPWLEESAFSSHGAGYNPRKTFGSTDSRKVIYFHSDSEQCLIFCSSNMFAVLCVCRRAPSRRTVGRARLLPRLQLMTRNGSDASPDPRLLIWFFGSLVVSVFVK